MSRLIYIGLYKKDPTNVLRLAHASDLSSFSFFNRSTASQYLNFATRTAVNETQFGTRTNISVDVQNITYMVHTYVAQDGLSVALVTDSLYPRSTINHLIDSTMKEYRVNFDEWMNVCIDQNNEPAFLSIPLKQKPEEIDVLAKITNDVAEIKEIMYQNIESILSRGEKLDDLLKKSEDLDRQSKEFTKVAKKLRCCPWFR